MFVETAGETAVIDWVSDARVAMLIIDPPGEAHAAAGVEAVVARLLGEAVQSGAETASVAFAAVHAPAHEIGDPEELLMHLARTPPASVHHARAAE